jgi:hypothetical protein
VYHDAVGFADAAVANFCTLGWLGMYIGLLLWRFESLSLYLSIAKKFSTEKFLAFDLLNGIVVERSWMVLISAP